MLLLLLSQASATCPLPRTAAELDIAITSAESAWSEDPEVFSDAMGVVLQVFPCVNSPLQPALSARLLRVDALQAFDARNLSRAAASAAGARRADSDILLPPEMASVESPLRAVWDTPSRHVATSRVRDARSGKLYVDGAPTTIVPEGESFVFQWIDGLDVSSAIVTDGVLPAYPRAVNPATPVLLASGGVLAAGAAVCLGLARSANLEFAIIAEENAAEDGTDPKVALDAARQRANTLTVVAGGVGAAAALSVGAAVVVARW